MKVKKILCASILCVILAGGAYADSDYVGFLARLQTTPEEFFMLMKNTWATQGWEITGGDYTTTKARFYDSLTLMQMALSRGDIDEMILPDFVAEYLLKVNSYYTPCSISSSGRMNLCFGFMKKDGKKLADMWNTALRSMKNDYTMAGLFQKYVKNFPEDDSYDYIYGINKRQRRERSKIRFDDFPNAPRIRVAVTGDLPPVDFIAEDGTPAGYSMAVLAEIGRRLRVNIIPVQVDTASRTAALVSGKTDVVFWYETSRTWEKMLDVPEEVLLSEPYLEWDKFMHLRFND